jgi:hypothetical protein
MLQSKLLKMPKLPWRGWEIFFVYTQALSTRRTKNECLCDLGDACAYPHEAVNSTELREIVSKESDNVIALPCHGIIKFG